ncbi:MAG: phage polymerase-related protein, partial [Deltaproteobacteria bacterium]|nr:phage polymerase-related protein [Deltaproteobacteria bacterium]
MRDIQKELKEVVSSLKGHLLYQRDVLLAEGVPVNQLPGASGQGSVAVEHTKLNSEQKIRSRSPMPTTDNRPPTTDVSSVGKGHKELLEELRTEIGDCQRCKLGKTRTKLVFGVGNPDAKIVFVGEGPGKDEDIQGEPFVGRAGQLLTDIITKGMKMKREDVYICNVVKCRPPENRNPEPDEVDACEGFLIKQLEI